MVRFASAALAVALSLPVRAGVVLQYEDDEKKHTTVEIEGKKFRSVSEGGHRDGDSTIFDGDKHVFYMLNDKSKTYQRMDEASAAGMGKGFKDAMEKAKAKMTPEQRAQMEAYMAKQNRAPDDRAPAKEHLWKFERAGGSQKVAGYACDNYRVLRDGKLESEGCFVPWGGPFRKDDFQAVQEMGRFFEKSFAAMSDGMGQGARKAPSDDWLMRFVETAPGFPAVIDRIDNDGKRTREMRLVKIERTSLSASRFVPPTEYREKPMNMHGGDDN